MCLNCSAANKLITGTLKQYYKYSIGGIIHTYDYQGLPISEMEYPKTCMLRLQGIFQNKHRNKYILLDHKKTSK